MSRDAEPDQYTPQAWSTTHASLLPAFSASSSSSSIVPCQPHQQSYLPPSPVRHAYTLTPPHSGHGQLHATHPPYEQPHHLPHSGPIGTIAHQPVQRAAGLAGYPPPSPAQSTSGHVWRDDDRRKSLRLDSGSLAGSAKDPHGWEYEASAHEAALRRASWAGYGSSGGYRTQGDPFYGHSTLSTVPQGRELLATAPATVPFAWSSHFPSPYQQTAPSLPENGSPSTVFPSVLAHPTTYQPQGAYLPSHPSGMGSYSPYTPSSAGFPPSAYTPTVLPSQTSPASSLFASPYIATASTSAAAYLPPTPHTVYAPTPTLPPQATLVDPQDVPSPVSPTYPLDASTPYIPASSASPSAAILAASTNRTKLGVIDLTGHTRYSAARRPTTIGLSSRRAVELTYDCQACRRKIGTLTLRGGGVDKPTGDNPNKYLGAFYCSTCAPFPPPSSSGTGLQLPANMYSGEASYYDTLSAAVDGHRGEDPKMNDTRPPPAMPGKTRSGFTSLQAMVPGSKKRRSSVVDTAEGVLACDVCNRDLASGTLQVAATGEAVGATIEVLCAHCETKYMRCSDCGGGGGQKGVGRWRCKEVFTNGRKTCIQSHVRLGTVNEMDYDVYTVASLSRTDSSELVEHCRDLYYNALLGTLAVPDMIENACPIARSYAEVEKICVDSWTTYEPLITQDVESSTNSRRYVALRWVRPTTRKKKGAKKGGSTDSGSQASPENSNASLPPILVNGEGGFTNSPAQTAKPVIREGKVLTGFILAEHDLTAGNLHVSLVLPTGAGESYDASTRLLQTLVAKVHGDLAGTNATRAQMGLAAYPLLTTAWTMHMTKRDSRIMSRLETRRGFVLLDDYLSKYPATDTQNFPPHRSTYLPAELLRGWNIYAKRLTKEDLPPESARDKSQVGRPATAGEKGSNADYSPVPGPSRRASTF